MGMKEQIEETRKHKVNVETFEKICQRAEGLTKAIGEIRSEGGYGLAEWAVSVCAQRAFLIHKMGKDYLLIEDYLQNVAKELQTEGKI